MFFPFLRQLRVLFWNVFMQWKQNTSLLSTYCNQTRRHWKISSVHQIFWCVSFLMIDVSLLNWHFWGTVSSSDIKSTEETTPECVFATPPPPTPTPRFKSSFFNFRLGYDYLVILLVQTKVRILKGFERGSSYDTQVEYRQQSFQVSSHLVLLHLFEFTWGG